MKNDAVHSNLNSQLTDAPQPAEIDHKYTLNVILRFPCPVKILQNPNGHNEKTNSTPRYDLVSKRHLYIIH